MPKNAQVLMIKHKVSDSLYGVINALRLSLCTLQIRYVAETGHNGIRHGHGGNMAGLVSMATALRRGVAPSDARAVNQGRSEIRNG